MLYLQASAQHNRKNFQLITMDTKKLLFNHKLCFIVYGLFFVLGFSSCVKISPSARSIPNDVMFAARANILRATYQVPNWKEVMREEFSIDLEADSTPRTNFLASGRAYIYGDLTQYEDNYIAIAINIRNHRSLERFVTSMNSDLEVQELNHFKYMVKNKSLLGWSNKLLVLLDARQSPNEAHLTELFSKIAGNTRDSSLLFSNENFRQALKNYYDVSLWVNMDDFGKSPLFSQFAENVNLKNNFLHLHANFDEGNVTTKTTFFPDENVKNRYADIISKPINKSLVENVPLEDPAVLLGMSLKPAGFKTLIDDLSLTEQCSNLASAVTLTLDDFFEMISGDVVIGLKDLSNLDKDLEKSDSSTALKDKKTISDLVMGVGIKNEVVYDSLITVLLETGILEQKEGYQEFFGELYIMKRDSMVFFTKNEMIKDDFIQDVKLQDQNILSMTDNNWYMLYANEAISEKTVKGQNIIMEITRKILKNDNLGLEEAKLTFSVPDSKLGGQSIITFKDKEANSLLAMLEVLKVIVLETKQRLDPNYYYGGYSNID